MFRKSAILAAAVALTSIPAASADEGRLEVQLEPGYFIDARDGTWYGSDYVSYNEFTARVKTPVAPQAVHIFLSLPREVAVVASEGDGWTCHDVAGGIQCTNPASGPAAAELPTLLVRIDPDCTDMIRDSFDVYSGADHSFGVPFICHPRGT